MQAEHYVTIVKSTLCLKLYGDMVVDKSDQSCLYNGDPPSYLFRVKTNREHEKWCEHMKKLNHANDGSQSYQDTT